MKISLVVPVFNEILRIGDFLKRIERQSVKPEVLVVDGGSTDGTREFIERYKKKHKYVKLINEKGKFRSPANARNTGVEMAVEGIVFITDVDAFFEKNFFKKIVEKFEQNRRTKIIQFTRLPLKVKTDSFIQEAYYWRDASRWVFNSRFFVFKKELQPKLDPSLGYGEDKFSGISAHKIIKEHGFVDSKTALRYFQVGPDSLKEVWKRYKWYGRTGMFYYKKSKDKTHLLKMILAVLSIPFIPLILIPMVRGLIYASRVFKEYPKGVVIIPLLEAITFPAMAVGFWQYAFGKGQKHRGH